MLAHASGRNNDGPTGIIGRSAVANILASPRRQRWSEERNRPLAVGGRQSAPVHPQSKPDPGLSSPCPFECQLV